MSTDLSLRLRAIVDALPLRRGIRVLEIGCGPGEALFDLAFAVKVGALDGRHPKAGELALVRIAAAPVPGGRLYIDGGSPLREMELPR